MLRIFFGTLHRWFGLGAAAFLFIAGVTGALISWNDELDAALNPELFRARGVGPALPAMTLLQRIETADPRVRVTFLPLRAEPGEALMVRVEPRIDPATGKPYVLDHSQVAIDPASGAILGQRAWGEAALSRANVMPFLYKLHYSLHLPHGWGVDLGSLLMGLIAIAWVLDSVIALIISFPSRKAWRRSFAFRWRAGGHKRVFDLHRSGGVWLFALVLVMAVTSVAMNLGPQVVRPLVALLSPLTPSPFADRAAARPDAPIVPTISPARAIDVAQMEATKRGLSAPPGALFLSTAFGVYGVGFYAHEHGGPGLGHPWIYVDARTGAPAGADVPGTGSAGDVFLQSMAPLHSGHIIGLPGRILVSLLGMAIAGFSVTGVMIWAKKRKGRLMAAARALPRQPLSMAGGVRTRA